MAVGQRGGGSERSDERDGGAPVNDQRISTTLVLLPGLLCDQTLWSHQVEHLRHLAEVRVAEFREQGSIEEMALSVLHAVPGRFGLAGLSMGGYVALEVMRRVPERVTRLALLDTSSRADTPEQTTRRHELMRLVQASRFQEAVARLMPILVHPKRLSDAELTGRIEAMAAGVGPAAFLRQQTAIMNRPDSRSTLPGIACPTLVLCGADDALTPVALHREIAAAIPMSRLEIIEDCGHLSTMEQPAQVTGALERWLRA